MIVSMHIKANYISKEKFKSIIVNRIEFEKSLKLAHAVSMANDNGKDG